MQKIKNYIKNINLNFNNNFIIDPSVNYCLIQLYKMAIDSKNKEKIKNLYYEYNKCKYGIENDIVYELYNENELNSERLQFIIDNCTEYLNISSSLITKLIKNSNKELLEILFKNHFKFFDNNFILDLLFFLQKQNTNIKFSFVPFNQ